MGGPLDLSVSQSPNCFDLRLETLDLEFWLDNNNLQHIFLLRIKSFLKNCFNDLSLNNRNVFCSKIEMLMKCE